MRRGLPRAWILLAGYLLSQLVGHFRGPDPRLLGATIGVWFVVVFIEGLWAKLRPHVRAMPRRPARPIRWLAAEARPEAELLADFARRAVGTLDPLVREPLVPGLAVAICLGRAGTCGATIPAELEPELVQHFGGFCPVCREQGGFRAARLPDGQTAEPLDAGPTQTATTEPAAPLGSAPDLQAGGLLRLGAREAEIPGVDPRTAFPESPAVSAKAATALATLPAASPNDPLADESLWDLPMAGPVRPAAPAPGSDSIPVARPVSRSRARFTEAP